MREQWILYTQANRKLIASRKPRYLYRRGFRRLGKSVDKKIYLHAEPHHEMRNQAWPLDDREVDDLHRLLHQDKTAAIESDLYFRAQRAGQITVANLHVLPGRRWPEPTEQEAETMLELGSRHGHDWKTWIIATPGEEDLDNRDFNETTPFQDQGTPCSGEWFHGVVQQKTGHGETDWIVIDLDRHSGVIPTVLFIQRLRELRRLLDKGGACCGCSRSTRKTARCICASCDPLDILRAWPGTSFASWRRKLPWLEAVEIFPDNLHQVILPLRPDKVLVCGRLNLVPKVKRIGYRWNKLTKKKRRYTRFRPTPAVYVWKWLQNPQTALPWEDLAGDR